MTDITDPVVVKFTNEHLRPLAETVRDLKVQLDEAAAVWTDQVSPLLSAHTNGDPLADGREAEGVSRLTKADLTAFVGVAGQLITALNVSGVMNTVRKPTVRVLRVRG
jgi:hypothetical protein